MSTIKRWTVEIFLDEEDLATRATARLDTSEDAHLHGQGTWRSAEETDDVETADDLAVAKALSQIAEKLSLRAVDA